MTHDLRAAIHRYDIESAAIGAHRGSAVFKIPATPRRLDADDREHILRARMKRVRELLNWVDGYGPELRLQADDRFEVIDGDNNGRVEPMGTMGLELTGFRDDFTLEGLRAVLVQVLGDVERRIKRGER